LYRTGDIVALFPVKEQSRYELCRSKLRVTRRGRAFRLCCLQLKLFVDVVSHFTHENVQASLLFIA